MRDQVFVAAGPIDHTGGIENGDLVVGGAEDRPATDVVQHQQVAPLAGQFRLAQPQQILLAACGCLLYTSPSPRDRG